MTKKLFLVLVFTLIACTPQSNYSASLPPNCDWQTVNKVYDGDTVRLTNGKRVRYIGIDALETNVENIDPYAIKATQENEKLTLNKKVCLTKDAQTDNEDKYGRILRYIYTEDGTLVNKKMMEEGLAKAYTIFPFEKKDEFVAMEKMAQDRKLGLWSEDILTNANTNSVALSSLQAKDHIGELATVTFSVLSSHDSGKAIFLNSESNYASVSNFTAVIFTSSKRYFEDVGIKDPASYYLHKTIDVHGKIQPYQGKPEIIVSSPNQIAIQP